jgi:chaperone required for assembly of F1-ATPase
MSDWAAKRFWTQTHVVADADGWTVHLDARPLRTPFKTALVVPTKGLAQLVCDEWAAQEGRIDPERMPATRMANSSIDKVAPQIKAVADMLAAYGETDLLCHRAEGPPELIARQAADWDPVLNWAAQDLGVRLHSTTGVMPKDQPVESLAILRRKASAFSPFQLAAFHDLVSLTGSAILGFAATRDAWPPEAIWRMSRLDEAWQVEQWGADEQAEQDAALKQQAFHFAHHFFGLATG